MVITKNKKIHLNCYEEDICLSNPLSESEKTVIEAYFKDPKINLEEILQQLENSRKNEENVMDRRFKAKIDVRSISKFKSLGLKKIRKSLDLQAKLLNLDKTVQPFDKEIDHLSEKDSEILKNNLGVLTGFDYRLNTQVYIIYTVEKGIFVWYEHHCNDRCMKQCNELLELLKSEHNIKFTSEITKKPFLTQFRAVIGLIANNYIEVK